MTEPRSKTPKDQAALDAARARLRSVGARMTPGVGDPLADGTLAHLTPAQRRAVVTAPPDQRPALARTLTQDHP